MDGYFLLLIGICSKIVARLQVRPIESYLLGESISQADRRSAEELKAVLGGVLFKETNEGNPKNMEKSATTGTICLISQL